MKKLIKHSVFYFLLAVMGVGCSHQHETLEHDILALQRVNHQNAIEINQLKQTAQEVKEKLNTIETTVNGDKIREIEAYRKQAEADANRVNRIKLESEKTLENILALERKCQDTITRVNAEFQAIKRQLQEEFALATQETRGVLSELKQALLEIEKNSYIAQLKIKLEWFQANHTMATQNAEKAKNEADIARQLAQDSQISAQKSEQYAARINEFYGQFSQLSRDVGALQAEVGNLHSNLNSVQNTVNSKVNDVDYKLRNLQSELRHEINKLERRLDSLKKQDEPAKNGPDPKDKGNVIPLKENK